MLPAAFLRLPIAHRAYHDKAAGRPENTLGAVKAAVEAGYAIEIDVQLSADGKAMVFHDDTLERLTGHEGLVRSRTAAELAQMKVLGSDETVPDLPQVLTAVGGKVPLVIEIKDQSLCMGPVDGRLEAAVAEALKGYEGPVAVMSFNPASMAHMARLAPDVPRGITTCSYQEDEWDPLDPDLRADLAAIGQYEAVGASFISHHHVDLANPRVAELKAKGAGLICWTIRSLADEENARKLADNVTFEHYPAPFQA